MSERRRYLAIDQGGHASRALLYEADGRLVTAAERPIALRRPAPEHAEHDPDEVVASIRAAVAAVLREAGDPEVTAAGLAVQRSSVVCWDRRDGRALSPVLSWQDRRNAGWLAGLQAEAAQIKHRTGLPLSPHYGAGKLRWCRDHLDTVRAAAEAGRLAWGPLASFLVFRLTAERRLCSDPANASRTLLYNLDSGDWDPLLAQRFGLDVDALPACVPTRHAFGELEIDGRRIPLTLVTGDQSAALFAFDGDPAQVVINLGTGAFLQQAMPQRPPDTPLLTSLAYRDHRTRLYAVEGTINGAGSALEWVAQRLGLAPAAVIDQLPAWLAQNTRPSLFLNGVSGLGTPYLAPLFAPRFVGEGSAAEQCVAVIESIVFLLQVNLEELARLGAVGAITLTGGLSRLDGLCQRLADLSGLTVSRPGDHEATARGLLYLLSGTRPPTAETGFTPQPNPALDARYRDWRRALEAALAAS
jgi:glycerol kinase